MTNDSTELSTSCGVRQGGSESPCLYNLFADYMMREYEHLAENAGIGVKISFRMHNNVRGGRGAKDYRGESTITWLGYADDLVLVGATKEELQTAASIIEALLKKYGLYLSVSKTKTMVFDSVDDEPIKSFVEMQGDPIENVDTFKYLGAFKTTSQPGISDKEIDYRLALARGKFAQMRKILTNMRINMSTRLRFFEVYVRSRLVYCAETWAPSKAQIDRVEAGQMKMLREMVRGGTAHRTTRARIKELKKAASDATSDDESERFLAQIDYGMKNSNADIYSITKAMPITEYVERQKAKWIAHLCRMSNSTYGKQLLFCTNRTHKGGNSAQTVYEQVLRQQNESGRSEDTFLRICLNRDEPLVSSVRKRNRK